MKPTKQDLFNALLEGRIATADYMVGQALELDVVERHPQMVSSEDMWTTMVGGRGTMMVRGEFEAKRV